MRAGFVVLTVLATLFASANTAPVTTDPLDKKTFTITSPESNDTLDGVFVQSGGDKFLILHLDNDTKQSDETQPTQEDADDSASDGREERAGVSAGTATELKKVFPKEYNTFWNKLLWKIVHKIVPSANRID